MKVIFLDVDGVLRPLGPTFTTAPVLHQPNFDELVRIVEATDCRIVISSGWRHSTLQSTLSVTSGFGAEVRKLTGREKIWSAFLDVTDQDPKCRRGVEILQWIASNCAGFGWRNMEEYAVLDDESVGSGLHPSKLFRTDPTKGLTPDIADAVIAHLNGGAR